MNILVTGGNGFIATNFIKIALDKGHTITSLDNLSYAASKDNHALFMDNESYKFIHEDIRSENIYQILEGNNYDAVLNFAAETHVDRSIEDDSSFISTNVNGTHNLISACRILLKKSILPKEFKFIQISTDEVYGSLAPNDKPFTENSPLMPSNPYSASKTAADLLCMSYYRTYNFPIIITRCSNNYGPHQYPEKLIPLSINRIKARKKIPIYGNGLQIRDWIYVDDHCNGVLKALEIGKTGEIYNFGGQSELTNIDCIKNLINVVDPTLKSDDIFEFVEDRPGHDTRYAINPEKSFNELSWEPSESFLSGITKTISWYTENQDWLKDKINSKEYKDWEIKHY